MPVPTSTLSKPAGDSAGSSAGNTPAAAAGLSSPPSNFNSNIWLAAGEGDLDSVRYLLDNQPDLTPTSPDDFSYTAVHAAASYAQLAVLDFLPSHPKAALYTPSAENSAAPSGVPAPTGAANVQDSDGDTPLFVCETVEPAKLLIEKFGADPKHRNLDGKTAAQAAYENEAFEVGDYLRSLTGEPEPTDDDYEEGGSAADAVIHHLSLVDVLHGPPEVSTAAHLLSEIVYQNKDRLSAGIIVAGWDKRNGGATVCNVPLGGGLFQQPWAIGGWNRQQTVEFVTNALALAIRRDRSSGGTIRLADISEHGVESQFIPGDKLPELPAKLC
ncbi:unnamed protein product [Tilletia controversa]|nr:unnamed protein product [Tilletia controversa]